MKIKSCEIGAFGCLENQKYDFEKGLNSFCKKNGEGKTTLAAFIKMMLYGMNTRKNSSDLDFAHYLPFSGKECGGNIVFEKDGKEYRIERSYSKTPTSFQENLKVYVNGIETKELGNVPGETLFGLSKEAFTKTLYIGANDIEINTNKELSGKMCKYIASDDKDEEVSKVLDKLENKINEYCPKRNRSNGLIASQEKLEKDIQAAINEKSNIETSIKQKEEELSDLKNEEKKLNELLKKGSEMSRIKEQWAQHNRLVDTINKDTEIIKETEAKYNGLVPSLKEITNYKINKQSIKNFETNLKEKKLKDEEQETLVNFGKIFEGNIPDEQEMEDAYRKYNQLQMNLNAEKSKLSSEEENVYNKYHGKDINRQTLDGINEQLVKYSELKNKDFSFINEPKEEKSVKKAPVVLMIISVALVVIGIGLGFVNSILFSVAALGFCLLVASGFMYLQNQVKANQDTSKLSIYKEQEKTKEQINKLVVSINTVTMPYGFSSEKEGSLEASVARFEDEYNKYLNICIKKEQITKLEEEKLRENQLLESELTKYYAKYNVDLIDKPNPNEKLNKNLQKYNELLEKEGNYKEYILNITKECKDCIDEIYSFANKVLNETYSITGDDLLKTIENTKVIVNKIESIIEQVNKDSETYENTMQAINTNKKHLEDLIEQNGLHERVEECDAYNFDEISIEHKNLIKAISQKEEEIDQKNEELAEISNKEVEHSQATELLDKYKSDHKILMAIKNGLENAQNEISNEYIKPISDAFNRYMEKYKSKIGGEIKFDNNFNIKLEKDTKLREIYHFSDGTLRLVILCYRLAIIDTIFEDSDKHFMIIDDYFSNMDEENIKNCSEIIKDIAKERQVFYFTCHNSRCI